MTTPAFPPSPETGLAWLRLMLLVRRFEERLDMPPRNDERVAFADRIAVRFRQRERVRDQDIRVRNRTEQAI